MIAPVITRFTVRTLITRTEHVAPALSDCERKDGGRFKYAAHLFPGNFWDTGKENPLSKRRTGEWRGAEGGRSFIEVRSTSPSFCSTLAARGVENPASLAPRQNRAGSFARKTRVVGTEDTPGYICAREAIKFSHIGKDCAASLAPDE